MTDIEAGRTIGFRFIQSDIGFFEDLGIVLFLSVIDGDTDTHADGQVYIRENELFGDAVDYFASDFGGVIQVVGVFDKHDKFVSAETSDDLVVLKNARQERAELIDDDVAYIVAVGIVDRFEIVDVEHQHDPFVFGFVRQKLVDLSGQRRFVFQPAQFVRVLLDVDLSGQNEFFNANGVGNDMDKEPDDRVNNNVDKKFDS